VLFGMTGCPTKPPAVPVLMGPDSTWIGATTAFRVTTTVSKGNIRFVMNWGDKTDTGDVSFASGETATVTHSWATAGTYDVKAKGILDAEPAKASEFSSAKSVKVILNGVPKVDNVEAPPIGVKDVETFITVHGSDPDNDSLRVLVDWGGGGKTDTGYFLSPCSVVVSHVYTKVETAMAIVQVQDWKGTKSAPYTVTVPIGTAGGVIWSWVSSDQENGGEGVALTTSVVIASDGTDERLFSGCEDDLKFYSILTKNGRGEKSRNAKDPEAFFNGHPGLLSAVSHIIVGSDEGELYALALDGLGRDWQWPDSAMGAGTGTFWGPPAFNGSKIYIGHEGATGDSLCLFEDAGSQGNLVGAYYVGAAVNDAPVIDASLNVIFGTDSGYLIKLDQNLQPIWRAPLGTGSVYGPILGGDGKIYCASDGYHLYAIDPATGTPSWNVTLDGDVIRPALGQTAIFVASSFGTAYSINPATGGTNWQVALKTPYGPVEQFSTTPIVAANGYVYFQSENDVLYCVNQADGTIIWYCDCPRFLSRSGGGKPHQPRRLELVDFSPNPSICANGNIIVIGEEATYCVAGYPEGTLATTPWPKWQRDVSNSGK
jgi:outer membrane protein assembly factor BamB